MIVRTCRSLKVTPAALKLSLPTIASRLRLRYRGGKPCSEKGGALSKVSMLPPPLPLLLLLLVDLAVVMLPRKDVPCMTADWGFV